MPTLLTKKKHPKLRFWDFLTRFVRRKYFKRDHEKFLLVDEHVFIGSSNIAHEYGGETHGEELFLDLNMRLNGYVTGKAHEMIKKVANYSPKICKLASFKISFVF